MRRHGVDVGLRRRAAEVAKEALASGRTVRQVAREWALLPETTLDAVLDARAMTEPGIPGRRA